MQFKGDCVMNERDIFLAALDITDPVARSSFLNDACAGNAALRTSVEALFASNDAAGSFLKTPLVQPAGHSAADAAVEKPSAADDQTVHLSREPQVLNSQNDESDDDEIALGFLTPSNRPDSLGRLGHYEVLEVLGKGAFGTVLKAFDEKLHRIVAIKVMSAELASTSPARKRFLREARSAAAIRHDNVVAIHAVEEQPIPYLVMEYIPGKTLQQFLEAHGPLDVTDTLRLSHQIASGLAAAHAKGLIHRDIKPSNILLEDGIQSKVKITDFGLARAADDASMTQSGTIAGTPMYMSPEQAHSSQIDQRSDLFSFGSVLYQMVSGRPPFRASSTLAVLKRVTEDTPRPIQQIIPEVPDWLCTIISKLHSKQPADRYQTANEVAELLARCQSELHHAGQVTCVQSSRHAPCDEPSASAVPTASRPSSDQTISPSEVAQPSAPEGSSRRSETAPSNRFMFVAASIIGVVAIIAILMLNRKSDRSDTAIGTHQTSEPVAEISNPESEISNVESQITNPTSEIANPRSTDPDRRAAEWVLSIGGTISIKQDDQETPIATVGDLPGREFRLTGVNLTDNQGVTDAGLASFEDCTSLTRLTLIRTPVSDRGLVHFEQCKDITVLELAATQVTDAGLVYFKDCRKLISLELSTTNVGDVGLMHFQDLTDLAFLSLSGTKVTDAGLGNFKDCKKIEGLHLRQTQVSDSGLAHFQDCKTLKSLDLGGTLLSDAGLAFFKDCPNLTHLTLDGTQVSDAELVHFHECKNLTGLNLNHLPMVTDTGLANFQGCKNLTNLNLQATSATDVGMASFRDCKELSLLNLRWTQVTDAALVHFKDCKKLVRVDLMGTQVSDVGLGNFKGCFGLAYLVLNGTPLSDAALPELASHPNLVTLDLADTRISQHAYDQLKAALPNVQITWSDPNRSVAEGVLAVGGTVEIGTPGNADSRPVAAATDLPADFFQVRHVSFAGVSKPLGDLLQQMSWLRFSGFDQLESVDLSGISDMTPYGGFSFLASIHGLKELSQANSGINGYWLANFPKLPSLTRLVLDNNGLDGEMLAHLAKYATLTELSLVNSGLHDQTLTQLPKLPGMKRLVLDGNDIRGLGIAALSEQPALTDLSLGCPTLGDLTAKNLAELKQLKRLSLAGSGLSDAGIKHLASLSNLESLDLRRTKATAAGIAELRTAFPKCKIEWDGGVIEPRPTAPDRRAAEYLLSIGSGIHINENGQIRSIAAIADLPSGAFELKDVFLGGNQAVTDAGLANLKGCTKLTTLDLRATKVGDIGLANFQGCKDLTYLSLAETQASDVGLASFSDCGSLTYLNLRNTKTSDAGIAYFKHCKQLSYLELLSTQVSDVGMPYFSDCKNLTTLDLHSTYVTDAGLVHFKDCKNLTSLSVQGAQITDAGLANFKDCRDLTHLSVQAAAVSDSGLAYFKDCNNLMRLNLHASPLVTDAGMTHFKDCKNLTRLSLSYTQVTDLGLANFNDCTNLAELALAGTLTSDAGLSYFKGCNSLGTLYLSDTQVSDAGLTQIRNFKALTRLELWGTSVSDAGLADLATLPNLIALNVARTRISFHGYEQLKAAMPKCQIIWSEQNRSFAERVIAMGGAVAIGIPGQTESRIIHAVTDLPGAYFQVRHVSLVGVTKELAELQLEMSSLRFPEFDDLESLDLTGVTGLDYSLLASIHGLQELNLTTAGLNDDALAKLPKLASLKRLILDGNDIRGLESASLKEQPALSDLSLGCPTLGDLTAKNLAELKQLKRLSLAGSGLSDAGIKHLASLSNLESLDLRRTKATAAGIAELQRALPNCKITSDVADDNCQ
jgi:serine/threonine protein kinase/Leucine-rich repeat (LRR) protein